MQEHTHIASGDPIMADVLNAMAYQDVPPRRGSQPPPLSPQYGLWAKITSEASGGGGEYNGWIEQAWNGTAFGNKTGGRTHTSTSLSIYEANGMTSLPTGTIVWCRIKKDTTGTLSYVFDYPELMRVSSNDDTASYLEDKEADLEVATYDANEDLIINAETQDDGATETIRKYINASAIDDYDKPKLQLIGHQAFVDEADPTPDVEATWIWVDADTLASDHKVAVSNDDTDPDFLDTKIVAGDGISLTVLTPGGNETLEISSTAGAGAAVFDDGFDVRVNWTRDYDAGTPANNIYYLSDENWFDRWHTVGLDNITSSAVDLQLWTSPVPDTGNYTVVTTAHFRIVVETTTGKPYLERLSNDPTNDYEVHVHGHCGPRRASSNVTVT